MPSRSPDEPSRPPGWYADPDRAETIRYWTGTGWSDRRRPRPAWSKKGSGALEITSPAPPAEITAGGAVREAAPTRPAPEVPSTPETTPPAAVGKGDLGPPEGSAAVGSRGGGGDDSGGGGERGGGGDKGGGGERQKRPGPRRSRRTWWLLGSVAVLAAVAVVVAGEAMRPKSHGPKVLTDTRFVELANTECANTIPNLRPADAGPFGTNITPTQAADAIDHAAGGLDGLAERLRALPAADNDRPYINGWLDGWHRYTNLGRQYATFLRQHGTKNPGRLLDDGVTEAHRADDFALANGLKRCTFSYTPQPDPSNGF